METKIKNINFSAFPMPGNETQSPEYGMDMRDYIAVNALNSVITQRLNSDSGKWEYKLIAETAYKLADEMLKQRTK